MSYSPPAHDAIHLSNGISYTPPAHDAVHLSNTTAQFQYVTPGLLTIQGGAVVESLIYTNIAVTPGILTWTGTDNATPSETRAYATPDSLVVTGDQAYPLLLHAWNPSDKASNIGLSDSNRKAAVDTSNGSTWGMVRGEVSRSAGKYYFEVGPKSSGTNNTQVIVGLASATESLSAQLGSGAQGWGIWLTPWGVDSNATLIHNGTTSEAAAIIAPGNTVQVLVDFDAGEISFGNGAGFDSGVAFTGVSGSLFPAVAFQYTDTLNEVSLRCYASQFLYSSTIPAGASPWGSDVLSIHPTPAVLTWGNSQVYTQAVSAGAPDTLTWTGTTGNGTYQNPVVLWADPINSITLTTDGMILGYIRNVPANHYQTTGKWYFEIKLFDLAGSDIYIGFIPLGGYFVGQVGEFSDGWSIHPMPTSTDTQSYILHNESLGTSYGVAFNAGDILQVAVDVDAGRVWFGRNGTWMEGSNPATNTTPAFTGLPVNLYPVASYALRSSDTGRVVLDALFSSGAIQYAVPSGFDTWQPAQRVLVTPGTMTWTPRDVFIVGEPIVPGLLTWAGGASPNLVGVSAMTVTPGTMTWTPRAVGTEYGAFWSLIDRAPGIADFWKPSWGTMPATYHEHPTTVVATTTAWSSVRATAGRSSGKWLWAINYYGWSAASNAIWDSLDIKVGLVDQDADLSSQTLGDRATEWMIESQFEVYLTRSAWLRNGNLARYPFYDHGYYGKSVERLWVYNQPYYYSPAPTWFAVDFEARKLWIYDALWWDGSGDAPPVNDDHWLITAGLPKGITLYPCVSLRAQANGDTCAAAGEFRGPIVWDGNPYPYLGSIPLINYSQVPDGFNLFEGWYRPTGALITLTGNPVTYTGGRPSMSFDANLTLPAPTLAARTGWRANLSLPTPTVNGAFTVRSFQAALTLPAISLEACTGWRADLSLPALSLAGNGAMAHVFAAELLLPELTLLGEILMGMVVTGELDLPALTLEACTGWRADLELAEPQLHGTMTVPQVLSAHLQLEAPTLAGTLLVGELAEGNLILETTPT